MSGTGARRISSGAGVLSVIGGTMSSLIAVLAVELAPLRVNLIAALLDGFLASTGLDLTSFCNPND